MTRNRRQVHIPITGELICQMLTTGHTLSAEVAKGLPAGALCVGCWYDAERGNVCVAFEHESFAPLIEGQIIPDFRPEFRSLVRCVFSGCDAHARPSSNYCEAHAVVRGLIPAPPKPTHALASGTTTKGG